MMECIDMSKSNGRFFKYSRKDEFYYDRVNIHSIHPELKFTQTTREKMNGRTINVLGYLVCANGSSPNIPQSYNNQICQYFNKSSSIDSMVTFFYDSKIRTIAYHGIINSALSKKQIEIFSQIVHREVFAKINLTLTFLKMVGMNFKESSSLTLYLLKQSKFMKKQYQKLLIEKDESKVSEMKAEKQVLVHYFTDIKEIQYQKNYPNIDSHRKQYQKIKNQSIEGGFFKISFGIYQIYHGDNQNPSYQLLAKKQKKENKKAEYQYVKMSRELQLVNKINKTDHLIHYYTDKHQKSTIQTVWMDYYEYSLQDYLNLRGAQLSYSEKICICKEIIKSIMQLHESDVVHRDIKPSNFLVKDEKQMHIKVIDFGESYSPSTYTHDQLAQYGCTHPYSPIQCSHKKTATGKDPPPLGIAKKQIDYWSVGVLIYQIFFDKLPINFSRPFISDIALSWQSELLITVNHRKKYGFKLIDDLVSITCVKLLKFKQDSRMNLQKVLKVFEMSEQYLQRLDQQILLKT